MALRPKIQYVKSRVISDTLSGFDHLAVLVVYLVDGVVVREIHWSGRFDGKASDLANWLYEMSVRYNPHIITTTETQQARAVEEIRDKFGDGWGLQKIGEYVCLHDVEVFSRIPKRKAHIVVATKIRNWAQWRQMHAGYFNLRHRQIKRRWRVAVVHGPSKIQNGNEFQTGKAVQVARTGWAALGRSMRRFGYLHPRSVQSLRGDCNADLKNYFFRRWFASQLGAESNWENALPNRGTHHHRLIDGFWIFRARPERKEQR